MQEEGKDEQGDIKQYIDKLESDKQNLIEKLEGANKLDKHTVQVYEEMYRNEMQEEK